ncbi:hypothetical protein FGD67_12155 [Colwellia sp. M166]|uniref:hypothetical protein n=1 Tax=Colwellia sp. M166 TaxID=2583805 RepID=UPI00211F44B2|nr:hypothetical protein [Colwellia sp. M166]UUO23895.1 hypothetical protein FGD67_12155 [Colwellia sp. M166]|tara:strand:- start:58 stop:480 length:423 start_codon:yes stop_codon:yes gene_type:complete
MNIMTEQLPISIRASDDLIAEIKNIVAISNKLEAQLNFHTMTANWYGEEENIIQINFYLLCIAELKDSEENQDNAVKREFLADDVLMVSSTSKLLDCHVAITGVEQRLLQQTPKLLSGYLAKKLTKVLNLIADRYQFEYI